MNTGTKNLLSLQSMEFVELRGRGRRKTIEEKTSAIKKLRNRLTSQVLHNYDVRKRRFGADSVVPVNASVCSGCHIAVSLHTWRQAQAETVVECEHCARLVYSPTKHRTPLRLVGLPAADYDNDDFNNDEYDEGV